MLPARSNPAPGALPSAQNTGTKGRGMNARDYRLHLDGKEAAARGAGLSDSPHGGRDGDLWRGGVRAWLDEHGDHDRPAATTPPGSQTMKGMKV